MKSIKTWTDYIPRPDRLESDNRKGYGAVWGTREIGAFVVSRGPTSEIYEVFLIDTNKNYLKQEMHPKELNEWMKNNSQHVLNVLSGQDLIEELRET